MSVCARVEPRATSVVAQATGRVDVRAHVLSQATGGPKRGRVRGWVAHANRGGGAVPPTLAATSHCHSALPFPPHPGVARRLHSWPSTPAMSVPPKASGRGAGGAPGGAQPHQATSRPQSALGNGAGRIRLPAAAWQRTTALFSKAAASAAARTRSSPPPSAGLRPFPVALPPPSCSDSHVRSAPHSTLSMTGQSGVQTHRSVAAAAAAAIRRLALATLTSSRLGVIERRRRAGLHHLAQVRRIVRQRLAQPRRLQQDGRP